jgi:HAMP domain-containing protein
MAKSNPKTMRFDSEIEEFINRFTGDSFTERLETMVRLFVVTEDEKNKRIQSLEIEIKEKENRLRKLNEKLNEVGWAERSFRELERTINQARDSLNRIIDKE